MFSEVSPMEDTLCIRTPLQTHIICHLTSTYKVGEVLVLMRLMFRSSLVSRVGHSGSPDNAKNRLQVETNGTVPCLENLICRHLAQSQAMKDSTQAYDAAVPTVYYFHTHPL
jgi:hypothetical protein